MTTPTLAAFATATACVGWHLLCHARDHRAATGERLPWALVGGWLLWLAGGAGVFWASYLTFRGSQ